MKNNGKNGRVRRSLSASANGLSRGKSGAFTNSKKLRAGEVVLGTRVQTGAVGVEGNIRPGIFSGPSVEGKNMKYIKAVSGTVEDRKPSFA